MIKIIYIHLKKFDCSHEETTKIPGATTAGGCRNDTVGDQSKASNSFETSKGNPDDDAKACKRETRCSKWSYLSWILYRKNFAWDTTGQKWRWQPAPSAASPSSKTSLKDCKMLAHKLPERRASVNAEWINQRVNEHKALAGAHYVSHIQWDKIISTAIWVHATEVTE